jgi:hypothetical protein
MAAVPSGPVGALRGALLRIVLPPLAIAAALLTAGTLVLLAATIDLIPAPAAGGEGSPPATAASLPSAAATPPLDVAVRPLARAAPQVMPPAPCGLELARLTYFPDHGGAPQTLPGPWLLAVESGALTVHLEGAGTLWRGEDPPQAAQGALVLHAGDALDLPTNMTVHVHNAGTAPAVALAAGVFANVGRTTARGRIDSVLWDTSWSPGATVKPLGGGWLIAPPTGATTITLQRLSLAMGAQMPLRPPGAAILAVETGALTLRGEQGLLWRQTVGGPDDWIDPAYPATLLPGEGALLQNRPEVTLRNDGSAPLLVLLLTVDAS